MKHDWEYKKLGEICDIINGLWTGKKPPFVKVGVIRNTNFTKSCTLDDSDIFYTDVEEKAYSKRKLQKGDIIIEKSGGSEKQPVGRPILFGLDGEYSFSNFTSTLRINNGSIIPSFLHKVLVGLYFQGKTRPLQSKTTGLHNLDFNKYLRFSIPVPPLPIQQQIVEELDKLSEIIEKKKQQVKELDTLAQSIFYDMFGDPNINEKKWETKKLSNLCINLDSQRKPITAKDRVVGSFPYYGASGIVDYVEGYILDGEYLLVSEDGANLLLRHTPIAFVAKGKIWVNNHAHILEFDNKKLQSFVEYFFKYLDISHLITGCAQPKLTQGNLNNIEIFFPSNTLIDSFAQKIEAIEKQKELINQSIKETQLLFDSRMDYYFGE